MTTPQWTVDDDGTLWFEPGDGGALEPWEALPQTATGQIAQPHFDAAYDALAADVAAARLVDDLCAVDHSALLARADDAVAWLPDSQLSTAALIRELASALRIQVAALHHARRQEGT